MNHEHEHEHEYEYDEHNYNYHPSIVSSSSKPGRKIYAWGSGKPNYAIPNAQSLRDNQGHIPFPKQITIKGNGNADDNTNTNANANAGYIQICADTGNVFCILDGNGVAFVWGNPRYGFPESPTPTPMMSSKLRFNLLAVGDTFVMGITKDTYKLMSWNLPCSLSSSSTRESIINRSRGKKKKESTIQSAGFIEVAEFTNKKVVDVAACGNFCLVIVEELVKKNGNSGEEVEINKLMRRLYMRYSGPAVQALSSSSKSKNNNRLYEKYSNCFTIVNELSSHNIRLISVGSTVRACVDENNCLYTWGTNRNGALGLGNRSNIEVQIPTKVKLPHELLLSNSSSSSRSNNNNNNTQNTQIVSLDCTRGQPNPKNKFTDPTGQEGPRIHLVTDNGTLWISGTCHKGLGADHLGKIMTSKVDHLEFYKVGGVARDIHGHIHPCNNNTNTNNNSNNNRTTTTNNGNQKKLMQGVCLTGCLATLPINEAEKIWGEAKDYVPSDQVLEVLEDCGVTTTSARFPETSVEVETSSSSQVSQDTNNSDAIKPMKNSTITNTSSCINTNYLSNSHIIKSVTSHIHSFALSDQGKLFGFGCGSDGRLGVPYFIKQDGSKRLMKCYVSTPSRVGQKKKVSSSVKDNGNFKSFRDEKILAVSCGRYWSWAIAE